MKYSVFHSPLVDSINMKNRKNERMGVLNLVCVEELRKNRNIDEVQNLCCLFGDKKLTSFWYEK